MCQNELQPLHYRKAYVLLLTRVEQVIMQLECGEEDVPPLLCVRRLFRRCKKRRTQRVHPD